jgi:glycerol kinase
MDSQVEYVFEGNINCTGDTIKWLVEEMELLTSCGDAEKIAASVDNNGGVYLIPAFVGLERLIGIVAPKQPSSA